MPGSHTHPDNIYIALLRWNSAFNSFKQYRIPIRNLPDKQLEFTQIKQSIMYDEMLSQWVEQTNPHLLKKLKYLPFIRKSSSFDFDDHSKSIFTTSYQGKKYSYIIEYDYDLICTIDNDLPVFRPNVLFTVLPFIEEKLRNWNTQEEIHYTSDAPDSDGVVGEGEIEYYGVLNVTQLNIMELSLSKEAVKKSHEWIKTLKILGSDFPTNPIKKTLGNLFSSHKSNGV